MRRSIALLLGLSLVLPAGAVSGVAAAVTCDPFATPPVYDPAVRTATDVLGFDFGDVQMTVADIDAYLATVDADSDRVVIENAATSVGGLAIDYAIVGRADRVTPSALATIRANLQVLRNPQADPAAVQAALDATPAVLWVAANVHGGEESGADAALHALYELAARSDCVVTGILESAHSSSSCPPRTPMAARSDSGATCTAST